MPGKEVAKTMRGTVAGGREAARGAGRAFGTARHMGGAGNPGLMRLLDVHAAASGGDTLVLIGLLATIFFNGTVDEARSRVALFLLVTMVPFAVLAPLLAPLLDRFRSGRRFALSASLAGRAVLAWIISLNVDGGLLLYVATFGVILLSRVYGVARSAALARLVPPAGLRLSQAAARAAVFATVAGAVAAALGGIGAAIGPQWPLRLASLVFLVGAAIALALPPLADTEPPEVLPRPFGLPWRGKMSEGESVLSGRMVGVTLLGSSGLRLLYGFLLFFLAFAIRSDAIDGGDVAGPFVQLVLVGSAFGLGTLIATAVGTALRVSRPVPLQATGVVLVACAGLYATVRFSFISLLVLCLFTAVASGLAKVAVDAAIQERVPEPYRPNAFARTETLLMLVWLAGGGIGLVPHVDTRLGVAAATLGALMAAVASVLAARRLRGEALRGRPATGPDGKVSGVLLQPGAHARALPPVPVTAVPPAVLAAPGVPSTNPPIVDAVVIPTPPGTAPPGYHVFHPSPPEPAPPAPMGPERSGHQAGTGSADGE
jgi:MFS family permease